MKTEIIPAEAPDAFQRALETLQSGGLVAFPTDTVYGVGALAFDSPGVESIYAAKDRPIEKAIPVLIGDVEDLDKVAARVPLMAERLAARFWPGPLTILVPKHSGLPDSVSATDSVGVRLPDHAVARSLLRAAGPMAVTSANRSGRPSPSTAGEVLVQLNGRIAMILDGGKTPGGVPSTLVDCTGAKPVVMREGPISLAQILALTGP
ncbi:MAG TPA: L-threonylcarbamoyladenylate synthase [Anaerolineales bacterium]|nr:L-threonylcarbamoyladenylate synthase [Anaerolineales bacterium]